MAGFTFGVVWCARHEHLSRNVQLLACAFLGVALLDFGYMLSANGMPDFITPSSAQKAIDFWLAARLLSALTLLAVAWLPWSTNSDGARFRPRHMLVLVPPAVAALHGLAAVLPALLADHLYGRPETGLVQDRL